MANEDQLKILRNNVENWNRWRLANPEKKIDLQGANLERAVLQNANLENADLSNANLTGAHLDNAKLRGAKLNKARLQKAYFSKAYMDNAQLQGAFLNNAHFEKARMKCTQFRDADIREAHFDEAELQEAVFWNVELEGAEFSKAKLQSADFTGAKLQKVDFQGAFLQSAILQDADLIDAKLQDTNLDETCLRNARLQNANLLDVKGFSVKQLAGADTKGIILSNTYKENLYNFEKITEASKNARLLLRLILLVCLYVILTVATTTDINLFLNLMSSPLPIIGGSIQIVGFFMVIPIGLFGFYVYYQLYLLRLMEDLASQPAIFPDGGRLDEKIYPWLLNGFVSMHMNVLINKEKPRLRRFQYYMAIIVSWAIIPSTLIALWWKYLTRHHWMGTILHIAIILLAILTGILFLRITLDTFRADTKRSALLSWKKVLLNSGQIGTIFIFSAALITISYCSYIALEGNYSRKKDSHKMFFFLKNTLNHAIISGSCADLQGANLQGANLQGANLRNANFQRADLRKANLKDADLENADFKYANLEEVRGITLSRLSTVKSLYKAKLYPELKEQVEKAYPLLLEKPQDIEYKDIE